MQLDVSMINDNNTFSNDWENNKTNASKQEDIRQIDKSITFLFANDDITGDLVEDIHYMSK